MKKRSSREESGALARSGSVSLKTLLLGFIILLVIVLLGLSAVLGYTQFRGHLSERQQVLAQDAATALGLSISHVVDGQDPAAVATFINALYDRGHYRQITFVDTSGEVLVDRVSPEAVPGVPDWFRRFAALPPARASAGVMQAWHQLGQIRVEIDPGAAYRALWAGTWRGVVGFLLVGGLATLLAWSGLRSLLRPLAQLEQQADLLRDHRFWARVPVSRTRELGSVAVAANHMAEELEQLVAGQIRLIEDLRSQTRHDPVTGLDNRASFDQRLRAEIDSREPAGSGCVALVCLSGFSDFNQNRGYAAGDTVLQVGAERLRDFCRGYPGAFAARRQGGDFALFLPGPEDDETQGRLEQLGDELMVDIVAAGAEGVGVRIGFVVPQPEERSGEVMARADAALAQARSGGVGHVIGGVPGVAAGIGGMRWRAALTDAITRERLRMMFQPTFAIDAKSLWFNQVLAQVEIEGEWVSASHFLPMVERYGLGIQLDQAVLKSTLAHLQQEPEAVLCIVFSSASLVDASFCRQTLASLAAVPALSRRLWVAIHEDAIRSETRVLQDLVPRLRELGIRVMVDRFGAGGVSFDYLQRRIIDGVRIDRSFVRHLDERPDARFFIKGMTPIARSRNVKVFLAGIESEAEWNAAKKIGVDGAMGYFLGRPSLQDPA